MNDRAFECTAAGGTPARAKAEFLAAAGALTAALESVGTLAGEGDPLTAGEVGLLLAAHADRTDVQGRVEGEDGAVRRLVDRGLLDAVPSPPGGPAWSLTERGAGVAHVLAQRLGSALDALPAQGAGHLTELLTELATRFERAGGGRPLPET